ncbi:5067_t:CDS:1, partial [Paraglomus occultum]
AEQQKALELQKHLEEVQNMEREKLIAKIQEDMEQKAKAKEAKRKLQMLQNQHDTDGVEVETSFPTVSFDSFIPLEIDNQE